MQHGAAGPPSGASAVATARKGENQFLRRQGREHVFRKPMEGRTVPSLKNRPDWTINLCTGKSKPALSFQIVRGRQRWDRGVNGLPVLKHAILRVSQCLKEKGGDPARKNPICRWNFEYWCGHVWRPWWCQGVQELQHYSLPNWRNMEQPEGVSLWAWSLAPLGSSFTSMAPHMVDRRMTSVPRPRPLLQHLALPKVASGLCLAGMWQIRTYH